MHPESKPAGLELHEVWGSCSVLSQGDGPFTHIVKGKRGAV